MSDFSEFYDPSADFDELNPIRPDAARLQGKTLKGKPCELIDNTGEGLPRDELQSILDGLIEADVFGFRTLSAAGGDRIDLDRRESSHIQVGENLYRLIVFRYEARIESF